MRIIETCIENGYYNAFAVVTGRRSVENTRGFVDVYFVVDYLVFGLFVFFADDEFYGIFTENAAELGKVGSFYRYFKAL